ncbi:ATP-binding protein [Paenibacillus sp. SI8]|uniref:ATP-binding protein n=1 Tax=unclassified Paenibacillus TaxID=185978 RepID=UPI0034676BC0
MPIERSGMDERERYFIVGRDEELKHFKQLLVGRNEEGRTDVLHIYGTGGVGKTTFLRLCRDMAKEAGACFILLDSRDFVHTEHGIGEALLLQLQMHTKDAGVEEGTQTHLRDIYLEAIARIAREQRVVLAFDTFEEMTDMEAWLRERLLPWLPENSIVLLAGRHPLKGGWLLSPAWRERLRQIPMKHLEKADSMLYLQRCGIHEENRMEQVWVQTQGHPLTLSLAAAANAYQEGAILFTGADWFEEVAALWLKEVPDQELRKRVEAVSVLRHFNQEQLSYVMEEEVPPDVFDRLTELSFVRKSERGWQLHDLMRESTSARLKERAPKMYQRLMERSASYHAEAIIALSGRSRTGWEVGELFRYAGVDVMRALTSETPRGSYYWETMTESSLGDAIAYLEWRKNCMEGVSGVGIDPVTGKQFWIEYTPEEVRYNSSQVDVEALFRLDPESIKLLRDESGRTVAFAVTVPLHSGTLAYLESHPFCGPYMKTLTPEEK